MARKTTDAPPRKNNPAMTAVALIIAVLGATFALLYLYKVSRSGTIIRHHDSEPPETIIQCDEVPSDTINQ